MWLEWTDDFIHMLTQTNFLKIKVYSAWHFFKCQPQLQENRQVLRHLIHKCIVLSFQLLLPVGDIIHRLFNSFPVHHRQTAASFSTMRNRQMKCKKPFEPNSHHFSCSQLNGRTDGHDETSVSQCINDVHFFCPVDFFQLFNYILFDPAAV